MFCYDIFVLWNMTDVHRWYWHLQKLYFSEYQMVLTYYRFCDPLWKYSINLLSVSCIVLLISVHTWHLAPCTWHLAPENPGVSHVKGYTVFITEQNTDQTNTPTMQSKNVFTNKTTTIQYKAELSRWERQNFSFNSKMADFVIWQK